MRNKDIIKVLGIQGVNIIKSQVTDEKWIIECDYPRNICYCPSCKSEKNKIKGYNFQNIKHKPYGNLKVLLKLKKRRLECCECGKTFYQPNNIVDKYQRISNINILSIYDRFKQSTWSFKDISNEHDVGFLPLIRYLKIFNFMNTVNEFPEVIGIDEFRGNADGKKFQVTITDIKKGKIIAIINDRSYESIANYLNKIVNKNKVKVVVMDMCGLFKSIAKDFFPEAKIICDKFHYTRLILFGLENVRKQVQKNMNKNFRLYFKRSKSILLKHYNELTEDEIFSLNNMLQYSENLRWAYSIKERFYEIFYEKDYDKQVILFKEFIICAENCNLKEFKPHIKSFHEWFKYIINSFKYKFTNGVTEGLNNKIKVIKRNGYGYRNFNNFAAKILLSCG